LFIAFRVAPAALLSLVKPFGTPFAVTPKGASARGQTSDRFIFYLCLGLIVITIIGLVDNAFNDWRVIQDRATLAFTTFWAVINCIIVGLAAMIAREAPRHRAHERFTVELSGRCTFGTEPTPCSVANLSLGGAFVRFGNYPVPMAGSTIQLSIPALGSVTGIVVRTDRDGAGIRFIGVPVRTGEAIRRLGRSLASGTARPTRRKALRVQLDARSRIVSDAGWVDCTIADASLSGAMLLFGNVVPAPVGDHVIVEVPDVGMVTARVARTTANGLGVTFEDVGEDIKDDLIRLLYTMPREVTVAEAPRAATLLPIMFRRLFGSELVPRSPK